jgi:hypothetical protein
VGQIKGIGLVGVVRALRAKRESADALLSAELRHYLEDQVVIASWYPEEHYQALLRVYTRLWPERSYEEIGQLAARESLQSVHRNILVGGVLSAAKRMKINWRSYHDSGDLTVETPPGTIRFQVRDYALRARELCQVNDGYFAELLRLSGAQITARRKTRCTATGDRECIWEYDWREASAASTG